jgi:hypothetical protein
MMMARLGTPALQRRDDVKAVAVAEPHVDHGESRRVALDLAQAFRDRLGDRDLEAAAFDRLGDALQERLVVVDDQERPLRRDCVAIGRYAAFGQDIHHDCVIQRSSVDRIV